MNFDVELAKFTDRQLDAVAGLDDPRFKFLLYGGALGGGKSYLLRWAAVRTLMFLFTKYKIRNLVGMIASENYPTLKDRQIQKISTEFPKWLGKYHADHKVYGRCYILKPKFGNGVIALRNLDDPKISVRRILFHLRGRDDQEPAGSVYITEGFASTRI